MQNSIFQVNDEPFCLWESDISERNREFLEGIDVEYFDYLLKIHGEATDEKKASVALRTSLHHAMETMFSLIGAYVQAPDCAYAWISKCSNRDLRYFIATVDIGKSDLFTKLKIDNVSWDSVAESIFRGYKPNTDKNKETSELFATLWRRMAIEFTDSDHIDEYNSIKHGLRIRPGGFGLRIGAEKQYGVPPPENEMKLVGQSEFGAVFFRIETLGSPKNNRNLRSRRRSLNWSMERTVLLLQHASMSIENIVSALKIANGIEASTCKFIRPIESEEFEKPWRYSPAVTSFNMDPLIPEDQITPLSKEDLLSEIESARES